MKRIAIVAVHGVIPHPKHGFQDEVATALRDRLNLEARAGKPPAATPQAATARQQRGPDREGAGQPRGTDDEVWAMDVVFPTIEAGAKDPVGALRSSIVRVHKASEPDGAKPQDDYYDVIEAYWSPLDKGRTNAASVLTWLLKTVFEPLNTTARYGAWPAKKRSDVLSILVFLVIGLLGFGICLVALGNSLAITLDHVNRTATEQLRWWLPLVNWPGQLKDFILGGFVTTVPQAVSTGFGQLGNALSLFWSPTTAAFTKLFSAAVLVRLGFGVAGAFVLAQALRASLSVSRQRAALSAIPIQLGSRKRAIVILCAAAVVCFGLCALWTFDHNQRQLGTVALWLVLSALAFEVGKAGATTFITNFFGDVQIYCTRDENAAFYEFRTKILDLVTRTIVETLKAAPAYDRVYVFAHSLGSTVSLDALMRMYDLRAENGVSQEEFDRIRGFVTFGTSLEKTRFFLDSYNRSLSGTYEEWRGDYYGSLFDADEKVLIAPNAPTTAIYWANYWFFNDFISDRISTYRSFLRAGAKVSTSSAVRRIVHQQIAGGQAAEPPLVAQNRVSYRLPSIHTPILHGEYLGSDWFWNTSAPVSPPSWLAQRLGMVPPPDDNDKAIGAFDIVTSHLREIPKPASQPVVSISATAFERITRAKLQVHLDAAIAALDTHAAAEPDDLAGGGLAETITSAPAEENAEPERPRLFKRLTADEARASQLSDIVTK
jgi:hypothetical protein